MTLNSERSFHRCNDCCKIWEESEIQPAKDLLQRVLPNELMPSGECPECGALVHPYEGDYLDSCPRCGDSFELVGFVGSGEIPVSADGWALSDGHLDTSEEVFECSDCGRIPAEWVFGHMTNKEAGQATRHPDVAPS